MSQAPRFTAEQAREIGERVGIESATAPFDVEQLRMKLDVELEHGGGDAATDVTGDDPIATGKIALAHLNASHDASTRRARMEAEAEAGGRRRPRRRCRRADQRRWLNRWGSSLPRFRPGAADG